VATVAGSVLLPGDAGYDNERTVWNLNHEVAPAVPENAADVQAAVTFATEQRRPVLAEATGHQIVGRAHGAVVIAIPRWRTVRCRPLAMHLRLLTVMSVGIGQSGSKARFSLSFARRRGHALQRHNQRIINAEFTGRNA
jgi:FAD binding domain